MFSINNCKLLDKNNFVTLLKSFLEMNMRTKV